MKIIGSLGLFGALCIAALLAFQKFQDVSAYVVSCQSEGNEAVVIVHLQSRLQKTVVASFDVCLAGYAKEGRRAGLSGSYAGTPIQIRHLDPVLLNPGEERQESYRVPYFSKSNAISAVVMNLTYR